MNIFVTEIWKTVTGYENTYEVSNVGRVRNTKTGKYITPKHNNRGYVQIRLNHNGKADNWLLHRLVAVTFIQNPNGLPQINHKDENKDNNLVDNLEWCTNSYNRHYGSGYERSVIKHDYIKLAEQNKRLVQQYNREGKLLATWKGLRSAETATGVGEANIRRCCYGRGKSAGGYVWKYVA